MKKKLLVCLAMAMCLAGFAGCGSKEEKKTEDCLLYTSPSPRDW